MASFRAEADSAAASAAEVGLLAAEAPPGVGNMNLFTEDDLRKIHDAVQAAERETTEHEDLSYG